MSCGTQRVEVGRQHVHRHEHRVVAAAGHLRGDHLRRAHLLDRIADDAEHARLARQVVDLVGYLRHVGDGSIRMPRTAVDAMLPRWITAFYLVYLAIPIALLVVGSFGNLWLNTMLPTGVTLTWYRDVAADPSFRRAFAASLAVARDRVRSLRARSACRSRTRSSARAARRCARSPGCSTSCLSRCRRWCSRSASSSSFPPTRCRGSAASGCSPRAMWCSGLPYFLQTVVADMQRLGLRTLEDAAESLGGNGLAALLPRRPAVAAPLDPRRGSSSSPRSRSANSSSRISSRAFSTAPIPSCCCRRSTARPASRARPLSCCCCSRWRPPSREALVSAARRGCGVRRHERRGGGRVEGVSYRYPGTRGRRARRHADDRAGRARRLHRAVRLRQDDAAASHRRIPGAAIGHDPLDGRDVSALPTRARECGVVFQSYALFPHMRVWENVAYPLRVRDVPIEERRRRALAMLDQVGLAGFADRLPAQLSGGQQQRVALGRALVFNPHALLLDEPLVGARRRDARDDARRDPPHPARARHRVAAHHARPGRGAVARRPHRRDARRPHRAGRAAATRSTTRRPTRSWRTSWAAPTSSTASSPARRRSTRRSAAW